ncbi:MAG: hypothetical protein VYB66_09615, partial [Verrucomicrobiota bacterium]|nr:hypothetical protein [Verrucomicrobiota bacterium]MEC8989495.1 hypothetical protein [Verrucomicrobiota bacterium]
FTGNLFYTLDGHRDDITRLSWRLDSNVIASASEDGSVRLWEMFNGKQVKSWTAHGGGTLSVQFSHSGDLVTAGRDRQVKIWDQNGKQKRVINGFKSLPLEAVFSNDGKRVFVGEWNGSVTAWDAANGKPLGELSANPPTLAKRLDAAKRLAKATEATRQQAAQAHEQAKAGVSAAGDSLKKHQTSAKKLSAAKLRAEKQLATAQAALAQAQTALAKAKSRVAEQNEIQAQLTGEQDANAATLAKATSQLPGLTERVDFLNQQLASLREVEKQTGEQAKQAGADEALKGAAQKATAATLAMSTALDASKAKHKNALTQTKTLPATIATGKQKLEQVAAEITRSLEAQETAGQQMNERNSQLGAAQKNVQSTTTAAEKANNEVAAAMSFVDDLKKKEKELRAELEQASAAHDDAMRQVAKWQAAQVNVRRLGEQLALRELKAELEGYTAA